jgi:hypothetical protein
MSKRGTQILKEALSMPPFERVALVEQLCASLDDPAARVNGRLLRTMKRYCSIADRLAPSASHP